MEKSRHGAFVYAQKVLKHSLFLFLLINLLSISPDISASTTLLEQKYTLNLSFKDARLEQVLDAIMKQSGVKIAYSSDELQKDRVVSVDIQTSDILTALRSVLGDGYSFKQIEDYIAIARKETSEESDVINNTVIDDRIWTIQGQVLENSEPPYPLPGVNILIKGTSLGTISDGNGYFTIKAKRGDILIFKYLGFKDYEYVVSRAISNLTVSLNSDSEELDEIVVTGISEEKRVNSVSAVSSLDVTKNLSTKPITSLSQSLQGGITGLNVTQSSGLPGADAAAIKIRGISTLGTSDPLVLVDGIPMDMNQLDPNTIESVTVLKDAAASAIYGARAANGVIVVKTKRGTPGKISISYNGYAGFQQATYLPEFVNAADYMQMVNVANANVGGAPIYSQEAIDATRSHSDLIKYPDTDWTDYMYQTGMIQSHSVSVSGGSNLARFALTANYLDNEALIDNAGYNRLNIRANTSVSLLDNLSVNMDFNSYRTNRHEPLQAVLNYLYTTPPNTVIHYPMKEGSDILYYGNIPNGSGLSSSASLEVLTGVILSDLFDIKDLSMTDLALIGQYSENNFNGCNCGIMDQFAVAMGKKDHAIFLDTATLDYEYAPCVLDGAKIVITNSKVKHSLVDSAYNDRRNECAAALKALQTKLDIQSLGDLSIEEFEANKELISDEIQRLSLIHI